MTGLLIEKPRKILLAGRLDAWMGLHWRHVAEALVALGHECHELDYTGGDWPGSLNKWLPGDSEHRLRRLRSLHLIKAIRESPPDLLLLHNIRFDMALVREAFRGQIVLWDLDGPAGALGEGQLPEESGIDLVLTVSRTILRQLESRSSVPAFYLPHGVSNRFWSGESPTFAVRSRFESALAFGGRPTPRRAELLASVANLDLVVWGRQWKRARWRNRELDACRRSDRDLDSEQVRTLYRSAGLVLDISREPFVSPPTTLSLQAFQAPAAGACLLVEWVEELEECFEPGKEVLTFRSRDELAQMCARYSAAPAETQRIKSAGQARCLAEHDMSDRISRMISLSSETRA